MKTNKWNKTLGLNEYMKLEYKKETEKKIKNEDVDRYLMSMSMSMGIY